MPKPTVTQVAPWGPMLVSVVLLSCGTGGETPVNTAGQGGTVGTPAGAGGEGGAATGGMPPTGGVPPTGGMPPTGGSDDGGAGSGGMTSDEIVPLPMIVDFYFFPSGAFGRLIDVGADGTQDTFSEGCDGDDSGEWDNVEIDQTDSACPTRPSEVTDDVALGLSRCTAFAFTPEGLDEMEATTWAGVLWQNTTCNWGADPPTPVAAGAMRVTFWAWTDTNVGETVDFQVGGIGQSGTTYRDNFSRALAVELTDTPTQYQIALTTASYPGGVISAFGWTAERTDLSTLSFYVDGMTWE